MAHKKGQGSTRNGRDSQPKMLGVKAFGGERVEEDNKLSNAYIFALDQAAAQMLALKYPDFYLCTSPGGKEAAKYIIPYDLVPATCDVYKQLVAAFATFHKNARAGGDRMRRTRPRPHGVRLHRRHARPFRCQRTPPNFRLGA